MTATATPTASRLRRRSKSVLNVLLTLAIVYAAWCALLYVVQGSMVFPRSMIGPTPTGDPPRGFERLWLERDGERIEAWFYAATRDEDAPPGPAVLFAHGNAELIDFNEHIAALYAQWGVSTLLVEYRGYGRSGGSPSQEAIVGDFIAFRDLLDARPEVDPSRVVYHGRSLGGAVVLQVAMERPARAIIAESTFTSVVAMARRYAAPGFIVRHPFRSDRAVRELRAPLLLMHGDRDTIVPASHSRRLAALSPDARLVLYPAGHNDFPPDPYAYTADIGAFLRESGVIDPPEPPENP